MQSPVRNDRSRIIRDPVDGRPLMRRFTVVLLTLFLLNRTAQKACNPACSAALIRHAIWISLTTKQNTVYTL